MIVLRRRRNRSRHTWEEHGKDAFVYEMLVMKASDQESLGWQVPSLAMTAQAFLLTIALSPGVAPWAHILAGILGGVIAGSAMQLMAKHRLLAQVDHELMGAIEKRLGIPALHDRGFGFVNGRVVQRTTRYGGRIPRDSFWRRRRSYVVWQGALGVFLLANLAITLIAVFGLLAGDVSQPVPSVAPTP